jgi:hypothetical protein
LTLTAEGFSLRARLLTTVVIGIALGYFEAAVVIYLRELVYPSGFSFPLVVIPARMLIIEVCREAASLVLIVAIAALAARRFRERLGYFLILFGTWDIFYYVWLKITIDWPGSLVDWDVLFLIPLPWIAPVIAPLLVAGLMIVIGVMMLVASARRHEFGKPRLTAVLTLLGTAPILYSFMYDTAATLQQQMPQEYRYGLLAAGLIVYVAAFRVAYGRSPS